MKLNELKAMLGKRDFITYNVIRNGKKERISNCSITIRIDADAEVLDMTRYDSESIDVNLNGDCGKPQKCYQYSIVISEADYNKALDKLKNARRRR